jgi:hypothetical protein
MVDRLIALARQLDSRGFYKKADEIDRLIVAWIPELQGEYWIFPGGDSQYADGDYGDFNHEMIAASHMLGLLGYDLSEEYASLVDAELAFQDVLDSGYAPSGDFEDYIEYLNSQYAGDDSYDWREDAELKDYLLFKNNNSAEAQEIISGFKDPRVFAEQKLGWIRIEGPHVELWELSRPILDSLYKGLYAIYDHYAETALYHIEITKNNRYLQKVRFDAIVDGSVVKMLKDVDQPVVHNSKLKPIPSSLYDYEGD